MAPRLCLASWLLCACVTGQGQAALQMVDGHPLLRATLRSGDDTYEAHLLLDLSLAGDLVLHPMAAGALGPTVDLRSGGLHLTGLEVETRTDGWLVEMTRQHAQALEEVPLVGMVGMSALAPYTVVFDGPGGQLWLLPAAGNTRPRSTAEKIVVDLHVPATTGGVQVPVELEDGTLRPFGLDTRTQASRVTEELLASLGHRDGRLDEAHLGSLNLAAITPFRGAVVPRGQAGTIGTRVLEQMVVTVHPRGGWLALERRQPRPFPEDEAAYYGIARGDDRLGDLAAFLRAWPQSSFCREAARELFTLAMDRRPPNLTLIVQAGETAVGSAAAGRRGQKALELLAEVPDAQQWHSLREQIAGFALPLARQDRDPEALRMLQMHLGILAHQRGELREARRQLLSAVFSMPTNGAANLALGSLYETTGELERARSRYFLALLNRTTRVEAWLAMERVHRRIGDGELREILDEMADGRVPALHPLPRESRPDPTGRVVLVEIFTGAHSTYSVAADLAIDALGEQYSDEEIAVIRWHLPLPAPQPLVAEAALDRAGKLEVAGVPLVRIGGARSRSDGGGPDDAEALLSRYQSLVDEELAQRPTAQITARAWLEENNVDGHTVHLQSEVTGNAGGRLHAVLVEKVLVFPGQNDLLFHHRVARAALTGTGGVPAGQPLQTSARLKEITADLDATFAGLIEQRDFPIRPTAPSPDNLAVVLYLEDPDSGAVVQALTVDVAPGREQP